MAEFQTVMSEFRRLCEGRRCDSCPILEKVYKAKENYCFAWVTNHSEEAELIIMQWAAEHPRQTNGMKFKEVFGQPYECLFEASFFALEWLHAEYKGGQDDNT